MAQHLAPDALLVQTNLTGSVTDVDESPDSPDANWLTASGQPTLRCSFPTPTTAPDSRDQRFRAWLRLDGNTDETQTLTVDNQKFNLSNLTGAYTDVDDDPDSPDSNWLTTDSNGAATLLASITQPAATLKTGVGQQEFRVLLRKNATGGNSSIDYTVHVYENGLPLTTVQNTSGSLTDASGETVISLTWDATNLSDASGAGLEIYIEQTGGHTGGPSNRRYLEIGAIEFNASSGAYAAVDLEVWESGTKVATIATTTQTITSTTGEMVEMYWDSAELGTASGANVEFYLTQSGGTQNNVEVGALQWSSYQGSQFSVTAGNDTDGVSTLHQTGKYGSLITQAVYQAVEGKPFPKLYIPPENLPTGTEKLRVGFEITQGDGGVTIKQFYLTHLFAPNSGTFISPDKDVPVTGVSATGSVGSVSIQIQQNETVTVSGVSATGGVGSPGTASNPRVGTQLGYFDASVAGPTDAQSVWTNDANAFDGSDTTYAESTVWRQSTDTEKLKGTGVSLPIDITNWNSPVWEVRSKMTWELSDSKLTVYGNVLSAGTTVCLQYYRYNHFQWNFDTSVWFDMTPNGDWGFWRPPSTDPDPAGWTASEIENLELQWYTFENPTPGGHTVNYFRPYKTEIRLQQGQITELKGEVGTVGTVVRVYVNGLGATGSVGTVTTSAAATVVPINLYTDVVYWDGSDAILDNEGVWTNDANAADGSTSTYAEATVAGGANWQSLKLDGLSDVLSAYAGHLVTQLRGRSYGAASGTGTTRLLTDMFVGFATPNREWEKLTLIHDSATPDWTSWWAFTAGTEETYLPIDDSVSIGITGTRSYGDTTGTLSWVRLYKLELEVTHRVSLQAQVGTPTVSADANVTVNGLGATASVGTVTVDISAGVTVPVTGLSATGQVDSVTLSGKASYNVSGLGATSPPGTVTITADCNVSVSGLAATAAPGSVTTLAACNVSVTGLQATGTPGSVSLSGKATVTLTGLAATGSVTAVTPAVAPTLVGVSAIGAVGTVTVQTYAPRFVLSDSTYITASGENTTALLTPPAGKTTGDFGGGRIQDDENPTDSVDIGDNQYREDEWCIQATTEVLTSEVYEFRVVIDGVPVDITSVTPQWTIVTAGPVTVPVTGVAATGAVGSVTIATAITVPVTGLAATASVGTVTTDAQATVSLSGLSATGTPGFVTVSIAADVPITGLEATGQPGSVTTAAAANVTLSGLEATGTPGSVTVTSAETVLVTGLQATGTPGTVTVTGDANVTVSGLEATGTPGSVTVTSPETVFVTGLEATGSVGTVTTTIAKTVSVTGLEATGTPGAVSITGDANVTLTGLVATGSPGTVSVQAVGSVTVPVTGLEATGYPGTVTVATQQSHTVPVTGVTATGYVSSVTVSGAANVTTTGLEASGQPGTVTVAASSSITVTGVTATGLVDTVTLSGAANVTLSGVQATGYVSSVTVDAVGPRFILSDSTQIVASGENTTAQLTPPSGKTTGDFGGGRIQDDENPTDLVDIGSGQYREDEWCIQATTDVIATEQYEFRVLINGQPADTYTVTPIWTIAATGAITVPVTGLAASGQVGSVTVLAQRFVDVPVSGLQATGAVGAGTVAIGADVPVSGLSGAATSGSVAVTGDANVTLTGLEATAAVGSVTVAAQANVPVNGSTATGQVDSITVTGDCNVTLSGLQATASRGSVVVQTAGNITVPVSGLQATGQVGSVTLSTATTVVETGQVGTTAVGSVSVTGDANVFLTGVGTTAESGAVSVTAVQAPTIPVSGVASTGEVGTVTVQTGAGILVPVTGFSLVGQPGTPSTFGDANVTVTGTSSSAEVGTAAVSGTANVPVTGLEATASNGSVTVTTGENVPVTGLAATGEVGSVTVTGLATVTLTGVQGNGQVGTVSISAGITVPVTSVTGTGEVGTVTITSGPRIEVNGVAATGAVGSVVVTGTAHVYPTGVEGTGEVGNVLEGFDYIQAELFLDSPIVHEINLDSYIHQNVQISSPIIYQIGKNSPIVVEIILKSTLKDVDVKSLIANYD